MMRIAILLCLFPIVAWAGFFSGGGTGTGTDLSAVNGVVVCDGAGNCTAALTVADVAYLASTTDAAGVIAGLGALEAPAGACLYGYSGSVYGCYSSFDISTIYVSTAINLGHASDTTLTRSAAGVLAVEGVDLAKITSTQVLNFGGATLEIPNSDDPDLTVTGQISFDTDGWIRGTTDDGTTQKAMARSQEEIHVTIYKPQDLDDAQRDHFWIWSNESGMSFIITGWKGWSTSDDTTVSIKEEDADGANDAEVDDTCEMATGAGPYTGGESGKSATIENGHLLYLDFDDTDAPALVKITIYGYYNGDVN